MQELHFTDQNATHEIQALFRSSKLIPFFGSGFTKGAQAKKGRVPDAAQLTEYITRAAIANPAVSANDKAEIARIKSIKSAFGLLGMPEYVTAKEAQSMLTNIFSEVVLQDRAKRELLRLDWPHIFTFNIDDAIERVRTDYRVLRPNRKTSREFISANKCLFKIHGDITEFSAHDDANLIFTWRDYGHSIESNKSMLGFLGEEAQDSAFLFVGCSLGAELDLIHLTKNSSFSKSIYLKKGVSTISDKIGLKDYGIDKVIYFDEYDQISEWLVAILKDVQRVPPIRGISFDDQALAKNEAITVITNGGPVSRLDGTQRVALASSTFTTRTAIIEAARLLRAKDCLFVTGRRFSGKTLFLFQLILFLKEYGVTFFGSTDSYDPLLKRELESLESHLFVFDSNCLNAEALEEVLRAKIHSSSRLVLCASAGDAERTRFKLLDRGVKYDEIKLQDKLDFVESESFNKTLGLAGLPLYDRKENLLSYAYRCYEEFKPSLPKSDLFSNSFSQEVYMVLILITVVGKAELRHIKCILDHFDVEGFVRDNERVFEIETSVNGGRAVICNAPAWLLKAMREFIDREESAYISVSRVIISLEKQGFSSLARDLIRFDKLNEISGGHRSRLFIKQLYEEISYTYADDSHYWLQRSKAELISAKDADGIDVGIRYARKVRLDNSGVKNKTYYSATLVLTQLLARGFRLTKDNSYLVSFISPCIESIENYQNNRRYINGMAAVSDVQDALYYLYKNPILELIPQKESLQRLFDFFSIRNK